MVGKNREIFTRFLCVRRWYSLVFTMIPCNRRNLPPVAGGRAAKNNQQNNETNNHGTSCTNWDRITIYSSRSCICRYETLCRSCTIQIPRGTHVSKSRLIQIVHIPPAIRLVQILQIVPHNMQIIPNNMQIVPHSTQTVPHSMQIVYTA